MAIMASVAICSASSSIGPETTLRDFFNRVYCRLKLSGKSANTKRLYDVTLRNFDSYLGRSATLADLNDDTVTVHIGWYTDRGRSPRTGNKARDQLLAIWRFAARKRFVNEWPDVEPLPEYKRTPTAWTPEQFSRLVAVASSSAMVRSGRINYPRAPIGGIPTIVWWPALLLTIYDTGIRIGAAMQLRCSDYSAETRRLHVRAETQKTRADQDFILSEQTAKLVEICISATQRELLFPCDFRCSLYCRFKTLLRKAGLPHGRFDKFHRIRKTTATMAELHVGPGTAQRMLDHLTQTARHGSRGGGRLGD
jgi:integrase